MSTLLPHPGAPTLFIVDLHCWMHRFWRTMGGRCAHGLIEMMGKVLRERQPTHFAVCTDLPFPTFRNEIAPRRPSGEGYKAHREPPDPTLLERMRWAKEMLDDIHGIPVLGCKGFEADDLIAALVRDARAAELNVVILGLDKDLLQLVDEHVVMWDGKKQVWGVPEVVEKFGIRPDQLRDFLAICGDTADNIPGVKGAGPKAAVELLQAYGTLEEALIAAHDPALGRTGLFKQRPRYRDMLIESAEEAKLSRVLATLALDAPLSHTIEDCRRAP